MIGPRQFGMTWRVMMRVFDAPIAQDVWAELEAEGLLRTDAPVPA